MIKPQSGCSPAACAANQAPSRIEWADSADWNDLEPSVSGVQSHMLITPLRSNRNHFRFRATCIKPFFFYKLKRSVLDAKKRNSGMGKRPRGQRVRMCP